MPGNDSATDGDTVLTPETDLAITKDDGVTSAIPDHTVTYTITASNAGPSAAVGATVTDTSEMAKAKEVLPGIEWVDVSDVLIGMRQVKTPEELALWRRAYIYFDRAHAFARDYILTHGSDVTDYEVGVATELWINDQLYSELELAGGALHHGVESGVGIGVESGYRMSRVPHSKEWCWIKL